MFDAQCDLAALVYDGHQDPDAVLREFAADLIARGCRVVGMVQAGQCADSSLSAVLLHSGEKLLLAPDFDPRTYGAAKLGETGGLQTPESVRYDPDLDVFYVSNINGNPMQHDGNGFITVVRADSTGAPTKVLVEGGKAGAKLDAPKGLALQGDTLWVADIDHLRAFVRSKMSAVKTNVPA